MEGGRERERERDVSAEPALSIFITYDRFYHEGGDRTISRNAGTFFFSETATSRDRRGSAISKETGLFKNSKDI